MDSFFKNLHILGTTVVVLQYEEKAVNGQMSAQKCTNVENEATIRKNLPYTVVCIMSRVWNILTRKFIKIY